jgi:hypothetical protein
VILTDWDSTSCVIGCATNAELTALLDDRKIDVFLADLKLPDGDQPCACAAQSPSIAKTLFSACGMIVKPKVRNHTTPLGLSKNPHS